MHIFEEWDKGNLKSRIVYDDPVEQTLRNRIDTAITELQQIQAASLTTEAAQIQAIKGLAEVQEKILLFVKRRFF